MENCYETVGNGNGDHHNPNGKKYSINHPFRAIISGPSGTGKTNALLNLINKLNCHENFYLFVKLIGDDPLYDEVLVKRIRETESKCNADILMKYSDCLEDLPNVISDEIDSSFQNIFVFDDMLDEDAKNLKKIKSYFTKMRKRNCSMVFITQDYFSCPKVIRRNCNINIFTKNKSEKDLQNIYQEHAKNDFPNFDEFKKMFKEATENNQDVLIINNHK